MPQRTRDGERGGPHHGAVRPRRVGVAAHPQRDEVRAGERCRPRPAAPADAAQIAPPPAQDQGATTSPATPQRSAAKSSAPRPSFTPAFAKARERPHTVTAASPAAAGEGVGGAARGEGERAVVAGLLGGRAPGGVVGGRVSGGVGAGCGWVQTVRAMKASFGVRATWLA